MCGFSVRWSKSMLATASSHMPVTSLEKNVGFGSLIQLTAFYLVKVFILVHQQLVLRVSVALESSLSTPLSSFSLKHQDKPY